jgi:hypothetical protein
LLGQKSAIRPGSIFNRQGGSVFNQRQHKVNDGSLVIKRVSQNLLIVESGGMGQQLIEVARADLNGDGFDDILLFEYCYATEGTLGFGGVKMITRLTPTGMFELMPPSKSCDC